MPCLIMRRILSSFRPLMQMGTADAILDLVSSGTTLRENNLKEISGGSVLSSQGVFVANKRALLERKEVLDTAHELLERFEAHLTAESQFTVNTLHLHFSFIFCCVDVLLISETHFFWCI
jgi:hypothetical protein